mgnify:CR=1 FL=1
MRILYVTAYYKPAYVYGGPVRSVSSLCEQFVQDGIDLQVLTTNANGDGVLDVPLIRPVDVDGVSVRYFPLTRGGLGLKYSASLADAIAEQVPKVDVVITETIWNSPALFASRACQKYRIPYIVPLRGQLLPWSLRQSRMKKKIYQQLFADQILKRAAALHCTDPFEAESVRALGYLTPTFVVPNGIDTQRFTASRSRANCRQRGIPDRAPVLLFVGRLHPKKRPDIALEVLRVLDHKASHLNAHLIMVGPDEAGLSRQLGQRAPHGRVHFTGLLDASQVRQWMSEANLFLMPSEPASENFGVAAVEALAAGLPVLVSEGVPIGKWAEVYGAGRTVPCTAEAFSNATCQLLSDFPELRKMGERGRILARERFDSAKVAAQMIAQIDALITIGRPLPDSDGGRVA